jgi:hypothetical protein
MDTKRTMNSQEFARLIEDFGNRVGLPDLSAVGDDIAFEIQRVRLHLSRTDNGELAIWSVLDLTPDDPAVFRRVCDVNLLLALSGEPTIAYNRDTQSFLLVRVEDASSRDGAWLEARIAVFLAAAEVAGRIGAVRSGSNSSQARDDAGVEEAMFTFRA